MDSEGQGRTEAASDQTQRKQQANIGVLAQQFSGLQVGTPPLKEPRGSHALNQCLKQTSNRGKSFDRESHKTSSLQTTDVTLSPVNMSVKNKRRNDEKDTALEISASKTGCSTGTMRHSETVILEPSVPSHSNVKQKRGVICAGSSTDLDQVTLVANGFNYETASIDIPISLDEKLMKLSLNSPEILLERGPVSKPRVTRTANDDKPYSRPDSTRPQSTANSSDTSMNYDDDIDDFIRALCKPLDVSVAGGMANCNEQTPNLVSQDCIPSIVFEKLNEKESEKKIPKPRKKKDQVSTKVSEPSSTEHLDASQILNPQSDTNHRDGQSSASVFGGPGQHPEVSVCPLTFTNQATVSQVGNQLPVFPSASQKGLYQQHGIPAVSSSDMCLLTASPMSCRRQQVFLADTLGQHEQQQETFQGMNTSRLDRMAPPTTSVIPDRYEYMTNPEQMQFNSCNTNKIVTIPQQTMPGLVVGNHMNVAQGIVNDHGHGWQNSSCGGQQINYCLSERNMSKDGGQVVPVQPTTVYPAHITENTNGGHQQNYGVDGSHGQQYIPEGQIGGSMANGLQHMTAGQMGDTMIYGGLGMTSGHIGGTMAHGSQHVTAAQISGAMINGGPHMSTHQIGGTMAHGLQHVTADQISGAMINGGPHMSPYQIGGTMVNRSQHVTADQIGGTVVNGGQHVTTGQMGGTTTNGGQRMTVGQIGGTTANERQYMHSGKIGGTMANWGQRVPAGQMGGTVTYGRQQRPTGLTGGTLVNGNLQVPAGHMSDTMVNGGQHLPADQVGSTIVHGGQNMTAREIESIIATGGQQIPAGQVDCVMANAGHQIGNQRMMSSGMMSGPLALLITLGQQFQNVPIQNGRRHRKLLPKQKR